jgi:hypothetical protein
MIHSKSVVRNQNSGEKTEQINRGTKRSTIHVFHINNSKQINSRSMTKCYSEKVIKKWNISESSEASKIISMKL